MSTRTASWLAWALVGSAVLLDLGAMMLIALTPVISVGLAWGFRGFAALISAPSLVVGSLILWRHPRHPVGWFSCLIGFVCALQAFLTEYVMRALLIAPGSLPAGVFGAWVLNWMWIPLSFSISLMLLYFPDGKLLSPRWRMVVVIALAVLVIFSATLMFAPGPMTSSIGNKPNPYGIEAFASVFAVANLLGYGGGILVTVLAAVSLLLRFRRSRGVERQQIKWVLYAAALLALLLPLSASKSLWLQLPLIFGFAFVFIAIGIAILRYRLFDIDVIIRRTLVYSILTVLLALIYFGGVVLVQQLTRSFTESSDLAIVISTLLIAALFFPLRQRVQNVIDRRFYRRKYDAQQVLQEFAQTVRDETDLDKLTGELVNVVNETMQPESVTLWLKPTARRLIH